MIKQQKGFTIIEVVLVLAIAGLIFLMVFIALPALQRGQRDSQREQDLARAQSAVQDYQTRNRNAIPDDATKWSNLLSNYLKAGGSDYSDPSGKEYAFTERTQATSPTGIDATDSSQTTVRIYYTTGAVCSEGGEVTTGQGARKVSLRLPLEGGGVYCVNN